MLSASVALIFCSRSEMLFLVFSNEEKPASTALRSSARERASAALSTLLHVSPSAEAKLAVSPLTSASTVPDENGLENGETSRSGQAA